MMFVNYDSHGLPLRSCGRMREPHRAHDPDDPKLGKVHCWGVDPLPADAEEKYCTPGCTCLHCLDIRAGLHPRFIMCSQKWEKLPWKERELISESISE